MTVVDANVVASLWLPDDFTAAAERLLADDAELVVPLLWRSEFRSVLAGAHKRRTLSLPRATRSQRRQNSSYGVASSRSTLRAFPDVAVPLQRFAPAS